MFFWSDPKVDIYVNAKVSDTGPCDDQCERCNVRKSLCTDCEGRLLAQGKDCVKACGKGYTRSGNRCLAC